MNTQILNGSLGLYLTNHPWLLLILIWSAIWKAIALWKSARNNHLIIFVLLTILNTMGIAEIIYLAYLYRQNRKNLPAKPGQL